MSEFMFNTRAHNDACQLYFKLIFSLYILCSVHRAYDLAVASSYTFAGTVRARSYHSCVCIH